MTEAEWLACDDPRPMLEHLRGRASERKLRLFAVACCRRVWHLLTDDRSRRAVEVAERYADGLSGEEELQEARDAAWAAIDKVSDSRNASAEDPQYAAEAVAYTTALNDPRAAYDAACFASYHAVSAAEVDPPFAEQRVGHCVLLRDIVSNPFRPAPRLDPAWLSWNGGTIPKLAAGIYQDRAFDRLPVLADALCDAGCSDPDLLGHLRGAGPHDRGCWAVDMLLGKG